MAKKTASKGLTREELERETKSLAQDLAFHARSPVSIQLVGGRHIAFTYAADDERKQHNIPIVMNPDSIKSVRNKEQALKIWRGIGYHELLHHLCPAVAQYAAAEKEGFRHLFNLVDDEHNERQGRAMDPAWGACFQAVCAHIFPHRNRNADTLSPGIVDGEKEGRKPRGIAADRVYTQRWNQFAFHFRRHIPEPPDPVVAQALALIPARFKDLTKEELFDLTRDIHKMLAKGIELPTDRPEPQEPEEEPEEKPEQPQPDDPTGGDKDDNKDGKEDKKESLPPAPWSLKKLLTSKWMFVPFGLFITMWVLILMQGGVDFWVQVAVWTGMALCGLTAFLFMRRALIKAMLASAKARMFPSPASGAPPTKIQLLLQSKRTKWVLGIALAAVALWLLFELSKSVGLFVVGLGVDIALIAGFAYLSHRWKSKKRKASKLEAWGMGVMLVLSLPGLVFVLMHMGFSWLFMGPVVLLAVLVILVALINLSQKHEETGKDGRYRYQRETLWQRIKRSLKEFVLGVWESIIVAFFTMLGQFLAWLWNRVLFPVLSWCWDHIVTFWKWLVRVCTRTYWRMEPTLTKLWRNTFFRLAVISLPVAAVLMMIYAVLVTAGKTSPWLLVALIIILLLLLLLAFLFRKKIKKFIVSELFMPMPALMDVSMRVPLDMETEWFVQVDNVVPVQADDAFLDANLPEIYPLAQQLRPLLKRCGRAAVDLDDQPEGYDLIEEVELVLTGETSVFVNDDTVPKPSLHIEVALDCSSSMASATKSLGPGEKFLLGKIFALVLEQAMINLPGVSGRFWGFTDSQIFDCGTPGEGRISGLQCGGGNNDAAMLWHMGQSAAASGKDVKILLMLSDGQPSECSWLSLKNLVLQFEQEGMIPWNFALDVIHIPAFERFFTDLVGQSMEEAIITMGETLAAIARDGV